MMDFFRKTVQVIQRLIVLSLLFNLLLYFPTVSTANAYDCGDLAPNYDPSKPFDPHIIARDLTKSEKDKLEKMFESLEGDWKGEAEDLICRGKKQYEKLQDLFTIRGEVKVDRDVNFRLEADLHSDINRRSHNEVIEFYLADNKLRLDTDSEAGDIENLIVTEKKVQFTTKRGIGGGYYSSSQPKREFFISLTMSSNSFTLEKRVYADSKLVSVQTRRFTR